MNRKFALLYFLIQALFFVLSCDREKLTNIDTIKVYRFDKDLEAFDTSNFEISEKAMITKYGDLYRFYIEDLMGLGSINKQEQYYYKTHLNQFLREEYPSMMDSFRRYLFQDMNKVESDLNKAYRRFCTYFPKEKPSKIFSFFISPMGANPAAAFSYGEDTIGFNLFNYLGSNFSLYGPLYEGYSYMLEWNQKEYIVRNIMLVEYGLLIKGLSGREEHSELIYNMIEKGKELYFLDKVCPEMNDAVKIGYTLNQYKWCVENEFEIWAHLKEHKLIYSTETMDIKRYTEPGPSTSGMPSESPGMVGAWIGWQIVKSYQKLENVSIETLLMTSPKVILKKANYKPRKSI